MKKCLVAMSTLLFLGVVGCGVNSQNEPTYSYALVWHKRVYELTPKYTGTVGNQLGVIERFSKTSHLPTNETSSNYAHVGTKLFAIPGVDSRKEIAVKVKQGYRIAVVNH